MKENKYFSQQKRKSSYYYYTEYDNNTIKEEGNTDNKILKKFLKKKSQNKSKTQIFPLITLNNNESKKIAKKSVREGPNMKQSKSSEKNLILKLKENDELKIKKEGKMDINLKTEIPLILDKNNDNDSSILENNINNDYNNKNNSNNGISSYFSKSIYECKNKKKKEYNTESLNDIFKELVNIKHKIKDIKYQKRNKITQFKTNFNKTYNFPKNNNFIKNNKNDSSIRNRYNKSYNKNFTTTNSTTKKIKDFKKAKTLLKPNINLINFRKSANSYRRFNDHIKYILHIRNSEMSSLANNYIKALEDNEKEKDYHYKNRIFPLEIIEKLNKIKDNLILNKFRNEYFKRIDRYDIHPLNIFLDNEKKNANTNKAKYFRGIFSRIAKVK